MNNDNFSDAFLEWRQTFDESLKPPQDPFSPRNNFHYYDIEDCGYVESSTFEC